MSVVGRRSVRRTKIEYGSAPSQFGHLYVPSEGLDAATTALAQDAFARAHPLRQPGAPRPS